MRIPIGVAVVATIAGFALATSHSQAGRRLRPPAQRIVQQGRKTVRRSADLLGLYAYLAAMNRGLPDREVLQSAYRSTSQEAPTLPFWGGVSEAVSVPDRTPEPAWSTRS